MTISYDTDTIPVEVSEWDTPLPSNRRRLTFRSIKKTITECETPDVYQDPRIEISRTRLVSIKSESMFGIRVQDLTLGDVTFHVTIKKGVSPNRWLGESIPEDKTPILKRYSDILLKLGANLPSCDKLNPINQFENELTSQILNLKNVKDDWHVSGAAPPNSIAITNAILVVHNLCNVEPEMHRIKSDRIRPSSDEGVCLTFFKNNRTAIVECYNTGELLSLSAEGNKPPIISMFEVEDIRNVMHRIVEFIAE